MNGSFTPCALQEKAGSARRKMFKVVRAGMIPAFVVADDVMEVLDTIRATPDLYEHSAQILSISEETGAVYIWAND